MQATTEERVDAEDWERFQQVQRLSDHWDRPDWPPERRYLTWYVVFDDPGLRELVAGCQRELADLDYLDPVPPDGLHMTVQGISYLDELGSDQPAAIAERATEECAGMGQFSLRIGPIGGHRGGTFLRATPWQPVVDLRQRLTRATLDVIGPRKLAEPSAGFKPHVSVTYCHSDPPAGSLIDHLAELRRIPAYTTVEVAAVSLLEVWRDQRTYRWTERHRIDLTAQEPGGST